MLSRGGGIVVNVSSVAGIESSAEQTVYCATKVNILCKKIDWYGES